MEEPTSLSEFFSQQTPKRSCVIPGDEFSSSSSEKNKGGRNNENRRRVSEDTYMCVYRKMHKAPIGVAYFDLSSEIIYIGCLKNIDDVNSLKRKMMPLAIITSHKKHEKFYEDLKQNEVEKNVHFNVVTLNRSEFCVEKAKTRIKTLKIQDFPVEKDISENDKNLLYMSIIDFESEETISALGGLLFYLEKHRILNQLEDEGEPMIVRSIKFFKNHDYVSIDKNTMRSLSVFATDSNPSTSGCSRNKEGISLFSYLDKTKTKTGRYLLKEWMLFPIKNSERLNSRLDDVEMLTSNPELLQKIVTCLMGVKDILRSISRIRSYVGTINDWRLFFTTLENFISVYNIIEKTELDLKIFRKIKESFEPNLVVLYRLISFIIDFPNSSGCKIRVKSNVSEELDTLKRHYLALDDFLTEIADQDMENGVMPEFIESMNITYLPQLGFLIMIPISENIPTGDLPTLTYQFSNEEFRFYKNQRALDLDEECGDIDGIITDIEKSIIQKLTENIIKNSEPVIKISKFVSILDVLVSFAISAIEHDLVRPKLTSDNLILIKDGWHPLQELCVDGQFIPNSCLIGKNGRSFINIITGPNNSGKSVYIKQCGLIVYMAHIGCFVPAKYAKIALIDMLFSRIQTQDNNSSSLSSFSSDSMQISYMLKHATEKSLLLIDEYGKGTSVEDGISLVLSIVKWFETQFQPRFNNGGIHWEDGITDKKVESDCHIHPNPISGTQGTTDLEETPRSPEIASQKPIKCCKVMISTHFHEIFTYNLLKRTKFIYFYQMSILQKSYKENDIVFLYKVKVGVSMLSYGIICAKNAGYPQKIIDRAKEVAGCLSSGKEIKIVETDRNRELKKRCNEVLTSLLDFYNNEEGSLKNFLQLIRKKN